MNWLILTETVGKTEEIHSFFESIVHLVVPEIIGIIELMGIFIIIVGSLKAFVMYINSLTKHIHYP